MGFGSGIRAGIRDPRTGIREPGSGIQDPGSGKNLFRIPDPDLGVKKAPDPGSGSVTLLFFTIVL
jgi:hypothetical protein